MKFTVPKINTFLLAKLPAAWICGVRLSQLSANNAEARVRHRWINQNPFGSMYFAVQLMAAELTTGVLVMRAIREAGVPVSMLVASCAASYQKKATGKIIFSCDQGELVRQAVAEAAKTDSPVILSLVSRGRNEAGEQVAEMKFEWTLKQRLNNR